jgi:hypothetical protein
MDIRDESHTRPGCRDCGECVADDPELEEVERLLAQMRAEGWRSSRSGYLTNPIKPTRSADFGYGPQGSMPPYLED